MKARFAFQLRLTRACGENCFEKVNLVKLRSTFRSALAVSGAALTGAILAGCPTAPPAETAGSDNTASPSNSVATNSSTKGGKTGGSAKALKLAFITNGPSPFWTLANRGIDKAHAEMPNVDVEFQNPADASVATQTRIVNDMVAKGVQGFAISPINPINQTPLLNKAAKKVVVITQDSDAPTSDRACYIGTDNHAAGVQAGEQIKKSLPNGGKIMLFVGKKDAQNSVDRAAGIADALKGSKVQIIDIRTDDNVRARAKSNVSDTIVKYPDIAGLVGLWSYNGPAILNAVQAAHKVGKIKIVCFDEDKETLSGIKSGAIDATIVQQPFEFGYQSVKMMAQILNGDKSAIPAKKQIFVKTLLIDKSKVDEFSINLNKMLGK